MQIAPSIDSPTLPETLVIERVMPLDGARILELGCGTAELTRLIARTGRNCSIVALEVDEVQHKVNELISNMPNVRFGLGGAQDIPAPDESFDVVMMFKSLHHVPAEHMPKALQEIRRVLRPGGLAYISEPRYAGDLNDILRLFHDELKVRELAFAAVRDAVRAGDLELVEQVFFNSPVHFRDVAEFESRVIGVTHTKHHLSPDLLDEVRSRFNKHTTADGASFLQPIRVDLLRKPSVGAV